MSEYKVIFRNTDLAWQEGCLIQICAVQVSRHVGTGQCYLQTKVRNVSDAPCCHIAFSVALNDFAGASETVEIDLLDADLPTGKVLVPAPRKIGLREIAETSVRITNVDGSLSFEDPIAIAGPQPLELEESLRKERAAILAEQHVDAKLCVGAPRIHATWWQCGCGAANVGRNICWHCNAPLQSLKNASSSKLLAERRYQTLYSAASRLLESGRSKQIKEAQGRFEALAKQGYKDATEKVAACKKEYKKATQREQLLFKRIKLGGVALLVFVVVAFSINQFVIVPMQELQWEQQEQQQDQAEIAKKRSQYERARDLLKNGDYDSASRLFKSLGDFRDSKEQAEKAEKEAKYQWAQTSFNNGNYSWAASKFKELGDYRDSKEMAAKARELIKK